MRSEAQKRADKKYYKQVKENCCYWNTLLDKGEAQELNQLLEQKGLSRATFLRWAAQELKNEE